MAKSGIHGTLSILLLVLLLQFIPYSKSQSFPLDAFPGKIYSFSDTSKILGEGGKSTVHLTPPSKEGVLFDYKLDMAIPYYYAGVIFQFDSARDFSKFSHIEVVLNSESAKTVRLFILSEEPTLTRATTANNWRHLQQMLINKPNRRTHRLALNQFYTPQWWFEQEQVNEELVSTTPLSRVTALKVETGEGEQVGVPGAIAIKSIRLITPIPPLVRYIQVALIVAAIMLLLFSWKNSQKGLLGAYTPVVMGSLFDDELERITTCIGNRYPEAALNLTSVAEECAMHPDKVTALLRRGYGQTYKQYLNRLRLTEAQRLLRTTDRSVVEIASAVGYNSVSHFNRVFKEFFNSTPREFRRSDS